MKALRGLLAVVLTSLLGGLRLQRIPDARRAVKAAWAEVLSQYQRRADLIPNIVATVKGEANFEQETLTKVIEARAKATAIQATPELVNDPEAFDKFQQAQGELSGALSRLLRGHRELSEPEGEPGVPGPARPARRHREPHHRRAQPLHRGGRGVQQLKVRSLPTNFTAMMFGYKAKPNFTVENEATISKPPTVDFGTTKK